MGCGFGSWSPRLGEPTILAFFFGNWNVMRERMCTSVSCESLIEKRKRNCASELLDSHAAHGHHVTSQSIKKSTIALSFLRLIACDSASEGFPDAKVMYSHGCDVESNDTSGFAAAVAAAKAADVVVYVGGNRNCEGGQGHGGHTCANTSACPTHCESEGHDRPDLEMPGMQTALLKELHAANSNVVLAVLTGGPISFGWEAKTLPAIITIWYGGQMMGVRTQPTHAIPDTCVPRMTFQQIAGVSRPLWRTP